MRTLGWSMPLKHSAHSGFAWDVVPGEDCDDSWPPDRVTLPTSSAPLPFREPE
ncbi:MAG: hypothetical protein QOE61_401 [Micromonosporaceae bacterium]|nr:hypothetical protein [Micromonosporaceae bacterium]